MTIRINRNRLREIRKEKGLSGVDLQVLSGVPFSRIYYIERGTHAQPTAKKMPSPRRLDVRSKLFSRKGWRIARKSSPIDRSP